MSLNYLLADMLTKIRNGQRARLKSITHSRSKLCAGVVLTLFLEGSISGYHLSEKSILIKLKYSNNAPTITTINCVSKPGRRVYSSLSNLWAINSGLSYLILSTPIGIWTDREARKYGVGGEVLCKIA